ncbi:DUF4406 domain-containing protein [Apibacter muscae]|uniref:DUF4406 domain-containing protein n=1 Tax=Apibacter muscae TaxID=2509004 RepID=UPI0011ADC9BE|nr:DUF4406 domain-containing protein [Apibacter muscae]TWP23506.1 DUF4406 domain-containing protein [Apibacter muscae]
MKKQDTKVYIAGKVSGEPYEVCKAKFNHRAELLRAQGYEVVNPMEIVPKESNWREAMNICIRAITECQAYFMLEDWRLSRGAKIELNLMLGLGLQSLNGKL